MVGVCVRVECCLVSLSGAVSEIAVQQNEIDAGIRLT